MCLAAAGGAALSSGGTTVGASGTGALAGGSQAGMAQGATITTTSGVVVAATPAAVALSQSPGGQRFLHLMATNADKLSRLAQRLNSMPTVRTGIPVNATWTSNMINYKHGVMNALRHVITRHGASSTFTNVGKFLTDTADDIMSLVSQATTKGTWNLENGTWKVIYDFQRTIGVDRAGGHATRLEVWVTSAGEILTAYPLR